MAKSNPKVKKDKLVESSVIEEDVENKPVVVAPEVVVESVFSTEEYFDESGDKYILVTEEGLHKLKEELLYLEKTKRQEVAVRLKEAISYGDLSENSEYQAAKEEQAFVEGRILELKDKIKNSKLISLKKDKSGGAKDSTVQLGTKVKLKNVTKKGEIEEYVIVGSTEANPFEGKISNESPLGSSLLDKAKGASIKVPVPAGNVEYKIMDLS